MKNTLYSLAILIAFLTVTSVGYAQYNPCRGKVMLAKSTTSRLNSQTNRLQSQITSGENRIISMEGSLQLSLANLRGKEEAAKVDRNATSAQCIIKVLIDQQFCPPSGRGCITSAAGCGFLLMRLEQQVKTATAYRNARQKSYELRIKPLREQLKRNRAKFQETKVQYESAQKSYEAVAGQCDVDLAKDACIQRETRSCQTEVRACTPVRSTCSREVSTTCRLEPIATRSQCIRDGYAQCFAAYKTCADVDCKGRAVTACP